MYLLINQQLMIQKNKIIKALKYKKTIIKNFELSSIEKNANHKFIYKTTNESKDSSIILYSLKESSFNLRNLKDENSQENENDNLSFKLTKKNNSINLKKKRILQQNK